MAGIVLGARNKEYRRQSSGRDTQDASNGLNQIPAQMLDGELKTELVVEVKLGTEFTLRAGKKMVRVRVEG